jgi:hypothetical protein
MSKLQDKFEEYLNTLQIRDEEFEVYKQDLEFYEADKGGSSSGAFSEEDNSEAFHNSSSPITQSPLNPSIHSPVERRFSSKSPMALAISDTVLQRTNVNNRKSKKQPARRYLLSGKNHRKVVAADQLLSIDLEEERQNSSK